MDYNIDKELKLIGQKVKDLRSLKKMTQTELASLCDIDIRTIQLIETGSMNMSLRIFFSLAKNLEIDPRDLISIGDVQVDEITESEMG